MAATRLFMDIHISVTVYIRTAGIIIKAQSGSFVERISFFMKGFLLLSVACWHLAHIRFVLEKNNNNTQMKMQ